MDLKKVDLTQVAVPAFVATMGLEAWLLKKRAEKNGPSAADYTPKDAAASIAMGFGSFITPFLGRTLARKFNLANKKSALPTLALIGASAAATIAADAYVKHVESDVEQHTSNNAPASESAPRSTAYGVAKAVSKYGGTSAVASAVLAVSSTAFIETTSQKMYDRRIFRDLGEGPLAWALGIIGWDFIYYWNHRLQHELRFLWAVHVIHHSSEKYNLSTAVRQTWSGSFGFYVPYALLSWIGVRPHIVDTSRELNLLYQYWVHTELVDRIGVGEEFLSTPSHHRVHHATNPEYLDRNHGGIFIIWDRLFGTFKREDPDQQIAYGITKNINSYNPLKIAGIEYKEMLSEIAASDNWKDRLGFVFGSPGWAYQRRRELGLPTAS